MKMTQFLINFEGKDITLDDWANSNRSHGIKNRYILGDRIGFISILNHASNDKNGNLEYKCDCGEIFVKPHGKHGIRSISCGKCDKKIKGYKDVTRRMMYDLIRNVVARKLSFDSELTAKVLYTLLCDKQHNLCAKTGVFIQLGSPKNASIDRIDSKKGCTLSNVQWVTKDYNMFKGGVY